jgi:ABC-type amino acid transport system permease subunit
MTDRQTIEMALTNVTKLEKRVHLLTTLLIATSAVFLSFVVGTIVFTVRLSNRLHSRINRADQSIVTGKPFPAEVLEARTFRLRDTASKIRAELSMRSSGGIELVFQD